MQSLTIPLQINVQEQVSLMTDYVYFRQEVEDHAPEVPDRWRRLITTMQQIIRRSPELDIILPETPYCIYLQHPNIEILNLPWRGLSPFKENPHLYLINTVSEIRKTPEDIVQTPVRILVWIASSAYTKVRLDYETEIAAIQQAIEGIPWEQVLVEVCPDGSLETLATHLNTRPYHILHFSGHGTYRPYEKQAYLRVEDPNTLLEKDVPASELVQTILQSRYGHELQLIMLAACRTADEKAGEENSGNSLTRQLLNAGIPYIGAMSLSVQDSAAIDFAKGFYRHLLKGEHLGIAFREALSQIQGFQQSLIPQIFCGQEAIPLFGSVGNTRTPANLYPAPVPAPIAGIPEAQNLRKRGLRFIGRRAEIAQIVQAINERKPVWITGFPGVGKTTLALEVAHRYVRTHDIHYLDVSQHPLPTDIPTERPVLLLLDKLDTALKSGKGSQIIHILQTVRNTPNCSIIVISYRRFPSLVSENLYSLNLSHPPSVDIGQKIKELVKSYAPDPNLPILIHDAFGGNYGCIEWGLSQLSQRPEPLSKLLDTQLSAQLRQSFLQEANLEADLRTLDPQSQSALLIFLQFPHPVRQDALERQPKIGANARRVLSKLQELSWVEVTEDPNVNATVWSVPPLLKAWINVRLGNSQPLESYFSQRHASEYFAEVFRQYKQERDLRVGYLSWLDSNDIERLKEFGHQLVGHLQATREWQLCIAIGEELMQILAEQTPAEIHNLLAMVWRFQNQTIDSLAHYKVAIIRAREQRKTELMLSVIHNVARLFVSEEKWPEARQWIDVHQGMASQMGDRLAEANGQALLSHILIQERDDSLREAFIYATQAIDIFEENKVWPNMASALVYLAQVYARMQDIENMRIAAERSIEFAESVDRLDIVCKALILIGDFYILTGEHKLAMHHLKRSYYISKRLGDIQTQQQAADRLNEI